MHRRRALLLPYFRDYGGAEEHALRSHVFAKLLSTLHACCGHVEQRRVREDAEGRRRWRQRGSAGGHRRARELCASARIGAEAPSLLGRCSLERQGRIAPWTPARAEDTERRLSLSMALSSASRFCDIGRACACPPRSSTRCPQNSECSRARGSSSPCKASHRREHPARSTRYARAARPRDQPGRLP